jgi:hypothetical protein
MAARVSKTPAAETALDREGRNGFENGSSTQVLLHQNKIKSWVAAPTQP